VLNVDRGPISEPIHKHRRSLWFCPGPEGRVRWTSVRVDCVAKSIEQPAYFAALHKSESGTFETCPPILRMSVHRKWLAHGQSDAIDPERAFGPHLRPIVCRFSLAATTQNVSFAHFHCMAVKLSLRHGGGGKQCNADLRRFWLRMWLATAA
jgi:hypothetical protein